jgi:hypothetical protein
VNRRKTLTRARFRVIRANGKVEQHILIFDPAELHSLKVNAFIELHRGDRLEQARPKTPDGRIKKMNYVAARSNNQRNRNKNT